MTTADEPQKVIAHLAEKWHEDIGPILWWNFPVEEPPYCGTPLDEHFPKYKTHFTTIDMPNEIEKPKQWVVRQGGSEVWYLQGFRMKYLGEEEIDLYCESCDKELSAGDTYIKEDEHTRYCEDCYEEDTITFYTVGGESVGNDNEIESYDSMWLEH